MEGCGTQIVSGVVSIFLLVFRGLFWCGVVSIYINISLSKSLEAPFSPINESPTTFIDVI